MGMTAAHNTAADMTAGHKCISDWYWHWQNLDLYFLTWGVRFFHDSVGLMAKTFWISDDECIQNITDNSRQIIFLSFFNSSSNYRKRMRDLERNSFRNIRTVKMEMFWCKICIYW
jgi:hypothetical protein